MIDTHHPLLSYPTEVCPNCKGNTWWYTGIEPKYVGNPHWECGTCHPPSDPKTLLKMRIIKGNWLLNKTRIEIWKRPAPDNFCYADPDFQNAMARMDELGKQYGAMSKDCIYMVGNKKVKPCLWGYDIDECFTCSNNYWPIAELEDKGGH